MRIAIIGTGGAGTTAAWLLDGRHDVTIFERNPVLGGHAHTTAVELDGERVYGDDGFSWFSDVLYPRFMRLLECIGAPTRIVPMALSFTQTQWDRTLAMPPASPGQLLRTLLDPAGLWDMLRLDKVIRHSAPMVYGRQLDLSWGEYLDILRLPEAFVRDVLTPIVAGVWGGPYDRTREFSAYTLMKYLVYHRPSAIGRYKWHVLRDGASSYIQLAAARYTTCKIQLNNGVSRLEPQPDGWRVMDTRGDVHRFDQVLVTAGARDARKLLGDHPQLEAARQALDAIEYYTVRVATHSDPSFMPTRRRDWRPANISWTGSRAALTVWSGAHVNRPLFTSYVYDREPKNCYHISTFHLPLMTPRHHKAIAHLRTLQGRDGLHFAGDWSHDIGCHEDAVQSALDACRRIDSTLPRIAAMDAPRVHPPRTALPPASPQPLLPQGASHDR